MINSIMNFIFFHTPFFYLFQSVWRDEAFSYFMAKPNILNIIINTASDFNPPLYYILLHFWINIAGQSDEILRLLSILAYMATAYVAYLLAKKTTSRKFAFFVFLFTLLNPMLVYYAFEIRMYSFYAFFTICTLYFFHNRNWKWYAVSSVLGLYTHSFFIMVIFSLVVFLLLTRELKRINLVKILLPLLFFLPWLPVIFVQFLNSKDSWIFPVDFQLVKSVLGNLFLGYEGTPDKWWPLTFIFSTILAIFFLKGLRRSKKLALLFLTPIFSTLIPILAYSIISRPIYVNRYLIFITVFEIMAVSYGIFAIRTKKLRYIISVVWIIFLIIFNIVSPPYHKKTDFKSTFNEINRISGETDYIFSKTPIGFLESVFYYKNRNRVLIYNPNKITIPNYIGINVVFPDVSRSTLPTSPSKIFLIDDDASFELIINM